MAIPEACGLWIEQRVQEELEARGDTGASLREIGRAVAAEVEKYFETKVKPVTIFQRARRMATDTNVSPGQPTETTEENDDKQKSSYGGKRQGAGRKQNPVDYEKTYKKLKTAIYQLKRGGPYVWTLEKRSQVLNDLNDLVAIAIKK